MGNERWVMSEEWRVKEFDLRLRTTDFRLPSIPLPDIQCVPCIRGCWGTPSGLRPTGLGYLGSASLSGSIFPLLHFYTAPPTHSTLSTLLHGSIHPLTFSPVAEILQACPASIKDHSSLSRYSRLPLPSIGWNSMRHIIRFPLQYDKSTSIIRLTTQLFSSFHCLVADVKNVRQCSLSLGSSDRTGHCRFYHNGYSMIWNH